MYSNEFVKLEWFGGDEDAYQMTCMFVELAHTWDDLIDKDKPVTEYQTNNAFALCLVYLPTNKFYQRIQGQIIPMWLNVISSYETANHFEREKDPHGVEISHNLRYAAGQIIAYAMYVCLGPVELRKHLPDMWKAVVFERFDEYQKEHLNV
jgi:hypothetical protein